MHESNLEYVPVLRLVTSPLTVFVLPQTQSWVRHRDVYNCIATMRFE